jgi:ribosomal protein S18 acetylase RimI-like enzyme
LSREKGTGIRPLNPGRDLGQLADLVENAFGNELSEGGARVLREIRLLSRLGPLNHLLAGLGSEVDSMFSGFVWEHEGRVVGNVTVNRPTGHVHKWQISNVAVLDTHRQQGVGRSLVEAALELIARRGGRSAYLFVRDDNPPALKLYRGLGFVEMDATTELKLMPLADRTRNEPLRLLQPLEPGRGHALYELVRRAEGPGHRWLHTIRRRQYVLPPDERLLRWVESFFSGESRLRFAYPDGDVLFAAATLRATRLWNPMPHRLQIWVHPNWRDRLAEGLAHDVVSIISRQAKRPTYLSLPACEEPVASALREAGFGKVRTLIMMRLDL